MSAEPELLIESTKDCCRLTLNRPERRNALSQSLVQSLDQALDRIEGDPAIRVVVVAARGPVFSSGHDLAEMRGRSEAEYATLFASCSRMMQHLRKLPQPVIARVQGRATAAGCQLVASCDLAIASTDASFATPGVQIGLFCTTPMVPLVRAVPAKPAMEMLLLGKPIAAERAYQLGLVNHVAPPAQLDVAVDELVRGILASSPSILRLGKRAFYDQIALDEVGAYTRANAVMTANASHPDAQEGISAFLEKRSPKWSEQLPP